MASHSLRCATCGAVQPPAAVPSTCPACGDLRGTLDVVLDLPAGGLRPADLGTPGEGIFRLSALLPLPPGAPRTPLRVGDTPLYDAPRIAARLGVAAALVKDDGRNPSASMKDRATAVALAHAASIGCATVAAASTGNAASSLATIAASMGMRAVIFVPRTAPAPKVSQMLLAGATVVLVDGTYDQAFDLCASAVRRFGWYSRNTATNPFLAEGKKTCAIEIAEALGWSAPDVLAVGVGDGCVFGAQHKAFTDLASAGLVRSVPRLVGVQAVGADPLARAFEAGAGAPEPMVPSTFADSISVGIPRDQVKALRAARATGGALIAVTDDRIREAMRLLAADLGVFAEPAGAAGLAGLLDLSARGGLRPSERVVAIVSGHGLKDTAGAMSAATGSPLHVSPDASALAALESLSR
jgi:threonine synthase